MSRHRAGKRSYGAVDGGGALADYCHMMGI